MEIFLTAICIILLALSYEIIKYNKKIKKSERHNNRVLEAIKKEENKTKRNSKNSKTKTQTKNKSNSTKKKSAKSKSK